MTHSERNQIAAVEQHQRIAKGELLGETQLACEVVAIENRSRERAAELYSLLQLFAHE